MPERTSSLVPFEHSVFRNVWVASLASNLGALIQAVGAAWLMTSIAASADLVALVQASTTLPVMIFSLASGALADSFDRRRVMIVAQLFMLVISVALALFAWLGTMSPWLLLGFTFLIGCGTALNNPSWQASVGDMVPRSALPAAVALNSVNFNLTRSVGPAIGGLIVATAGAAAAFAINAVSYLPLIFVLSRWKPDVQPNTLPPERMWTAMTAGLRYVAMSPHIEKVLLRGFVFGFTAVAMLALLPLVTRDMLDGGALLYGLMLGCYGIGAVGGAFLGGRLREVLSNETIARMAFMGFAVSASVTAWSSHAWLTGLAVALGGACWVLALALFNVTVQLSTPRWVLGRALALYQTATFGGMALGSWVWGLVAEEYSISSSLLAAATFMVVGAGIGLRLALPDRSSLDLDPLNRWKAPPLALDLQSRSGPMVILIEYVIREEDVPAFLDAMAERRRIRRRDGARQWELMRDTEKPEQWIESFHVPTWLDYVRHNQRTTKADASVSDTIRALHSGAEPPRVHRMVVRPATRQRAARDPKPHDDLH
ncbi:MFS transporter [Aquibium oceanicum]|uniref:MFS transporter n=1 Tax=Aquibium oceanicum TaxID=1670800 RepID=A0A1L3SY42_9HYPH|nr:MFS transporter [Aquibium oceanicum]APH74264.1 MFS transporter [Aquibium oceanicum]